MTAVDPKTVESIFIALMHMSEVERPSALSRMCDGNADLQREVESLLRFHDETSPGALDRSPLLSLSAGLAASLDENQLPPRPTAAGFTLQSVLGSGGMGVVYVAQQHRPKRTVALKVIRPAAAHGALLRRFEHEAELLARLQHPGIAQVYEAGIADFGHGSQPFIAMELVNGRNLLEYIEQHSLTTRERLELIARIADAVQHAHQRGVIHRDLKPANILVLQDGIEASRQHGIQTNERSMPRSLDASAPRPKILDFGVARAIDSDLAASMQTSAGQIIGTLPYMSPEQVAADPNAVDTRSDVYALGVILYQALTNELPHDLGGKSLAEAARIITDHTPATLGSINGAFRGDIETIAAKAMEKDRERRYQSAADFAADIRRHLAHEPLMARPATRMYQLRKFARRNKALVTAAVAVFAALTAGIIVSWTQKVQADRASAQADTQRTLAEARLADAEAVRDFLRDMLGSVDPRADGRDVRVIEVLERASGRVDHGFDDQPAIEASLHDALGIAYLSLALHDKAEPHLTRALALNRGLHAGDHADTARALHSLGSLRLSQGNFAAARTLLDEALAMRQRLFTGPHRSVAETLNAIGLVHRAMGELDQAETCSRGSIAMLVELVGPDDLSITAYYDDLARLLFAQGKYDEAASLHAKSLTIRRRELGNDHVDVALTLNHYAQTQFVSGDLAGAEQSLREALAINRKVMGEQHTAVADTLSNLAVLRRSQRDLDDAENLVREALAMRRALLGGDHQDVATTTNELANIVRDKGDPAAAEPLYRQSLEIFRRAAGGEDNPFSAIALNNLADVLASLKRADESEAAYREAAEIRRAKLPPGHPQLAESLLGLGVLLTKAQRAAEAEPPLREALEIRRSAFGPDSIQAALVEHALGVCLLAQAQYQPAEDALLHSLNAMQTQRGQEHPQTLAVRQHLVDLYNAWGKPERIEGIRSAATQPAAAPASAP